MSPQTNFPQIIDDLSINVQQSAFTSHLTVCLNHRETVKGGMVGHYSGAVVTAPLSEKPASKSVISSGHV